MKPFYLKKNLSMSKLRDLYLGKAAQLFVMSEFVIRGYNAAIPEVDIGDDILVIRDMDDSLSKIQVKATNTCQELTSYGNQGIFRVQFNLKKTQLLRDPIAPFYFIFLIRRHYQWNEPIIFPQHVLSNDFIAGEVGTENAENVKFWFKIYPDGTVTCNKNDYSEYRGNWSHWPIVRDWP